MMVFVSSYLASRCQYLLHYMRLLIRITVIAQSFASFPPAKFSIQKCLSLKLIAFPMWFHYGEEVLDQNFSSVMDNVLIDCVSHFSPSLPRG